MRKVHAESLVFSNSHFENRRIINGKKFHVLHQEVCINKTIDEVWDEVAGNFVHSGKIADSINSSRCLSGDLTQGLGTERYLNINFQGKNIEVKERIIDFRGSGDNREFTYDVYETKGAPLNIKTYNTWIVRKGMDGKTYLGTVFIFRASLSILNGLLGKNLKKSGSLRNGLLCYKHFLETGEKKVAEKKLNQLYPL